MNSVVAKKHTIYISVGSNIEREKYTKAGLQAMHDIFGPLILSQVYESESVGFEGKNFYNLVVKAYTHLDIPEVCQALKQIEKQNKRQRGTEKFSPRTLDLDLLLFNQQVTSVPVELPRPEILYNAFVLLPLSEIAAHEFHPLAKQTYQQLWQNYDKNSQLLWPIEFTWSAH